MAETWTNRDKIGTDPSELVLIMINNMFGLINRANPRTINHSELTCIRSYHMEYMTIKEAAAKWGLSERRIQEICELEKVPGVTKFGRAWAIPKGAKRPADLRVKSGRYKKS